ncbi:S-layer homology domain-containing protein [Paenibacillus pasadenensis]|uniref:S-layer homology domain-containing protein n=1 Tax=Paenibacillus pasadenensis TaxID=217090 RepID=UPI002041E2E1|nr:S-layer homology domain-containing protein [Paenibacillus pasadenensis]MCM3747567.1 S-layer homology domain-containing protein [Paenibacillus pasadenensis]
MKKSLSLVVTGALVTSVFASSAFAAELTTQQKFDALKQAGILNGYPDGTSGLNKNITRAEFSKVLVLLNALTPDAAAANYKDVSANHWAKGFIGAGTKAGYLNGLGNNLFGPSQNLTIEQVAKTLVIAAGLQPKNDAAVSGAVSAWAKGYVAAAIEAGLIDQAASYKVAASRGQVVEAAYELSDAAVSVKSAVAVDASNIEVTFSDNQVVKQALTTPLESGKETTVKVTYNGKEYEVKVTLQAVKAVEAAQSGAKAVTVKFNRALTATEKTYLDGGYTLKSSLSTFPVTAKFADDNKSVVLSAVYLPVGDYTLTVKGTDAPFSVKVAASVASKIDITAPALQLADNVDLGVKVFNQFGEDVTATNSTYIQAFNNTQPTKPVTVSAGKVSLKAAGANAGDKIAVTAVSPSTGLSVSKTLNVVTGSTATVLELGDVQPLAGKTRISSGETGLIVPLTLKDANGQAIKLTAGDIDFKNGVASNVYSNYKEKDGLFFYNSDNRVIEKITVDSNGVLKFTAKASGTTTLTISNPSAGISKSIIINVAGSAVVKEFQIGAPSSLVVAGEEVVFPFVATDSFGGEIKGTALDLNQLDFSANYLAAGYPKVNAKGELVLKFTQEGYSYIVVRGKTSTSAPSTLNVQIQKPSTTTGVNGIKDVITTLEDGASVEFDQDNIVLVDSYGRTSTAAAGTYTVDIESDVTGLLTYSGNKLVAASDKSGSAKVTVKSVVSGAESYSFTVDVVESASVKSFEIKSIGTVFAKKTAGTDYSKSVALTGKTDGGVTVALANSSASFVSSNDETVLKVESDYQLTGQKAGKSTVTAYVGGKAVATQEVTVSEDAPIAKTVEFGKSEYEVTGSATVSVTVKDQYGVKVASPIGYFSSSNTDIATVDSAGVVTGKKKGTATITYVTSNGVTATTTVVVN